MRWRDEREDGDAEFMDLAPVPGMLAAACSDT